MQASILSKLLSVSAFALVALVSGCGEKVPLPARKSTYDISISGDLYLGEPIQFSTNAPSGKRLLWKFGDGETSIETSPIHIYSTVPSNGSAILDDTVTLIVDNDIYQPNTSTFRLKPGIRLLLGTHVWKGGKFTMHGNCCPGYTNHVLADTIFNIAAVDEYTIGTWGNSLPYLADSNYYSNERVTGMYNNTWIKYTTDTIYFNQRSGSQAGWYEVSYYHKY
jgi:hypothetical protein